MARFSARRARVLDQLGSSALVLSAGPLRFKNADSEYRFRPTSDFLYLSGWGEPDAVLVLRAHADEDRFVLFVPPRLPEAELWTGARLGCDGARELLRADAAYPISELSERLPQLLDGAEHLYARLGSEEGLDRLLLQTLTSARSRAQRHGGRPVGVLDPGAVLDDMRLIKDAEELERIRHACAITVEGFRAGVAAVRAGAGEWEVQAALEGAFLRQRAQGPAFGTIVGGGPRACVLHYTANDQPLPDQGWVLIDAGAEAAAYAGDVTRTLPVAGRPHPLAGELYAAVLNAKRAGFDTIRPGATIDDVESAVRTRLEEALTALGVVPAGDEEVRRARFKALIPHKASHWLGLDVHDVGAYRVHGASRTFEPGMVLTVEPGIYIPADDERAPSELRGLGIRIEDDALVTAQGVENLTAALPDDLESVLALRDGVGG